jgi:hypothetical protein
LYVYLPHWRISTSGTITVVNELWSQMFTDAKVYAQKYTSRFVRGDGEGAHTDAWSDKWSYIRTPNDQISFDYRLGAVEVPDGVDPDQIGMAILSLRKRSCNADGEVASSMPKNDYSSKTWNSQIWAKTFIMRLQRKPACQPQAEGSGTKTERGRLRRRLFPRAAINATGDSTGDACTL